MADRKIILHSDNPQTLEDFSLESEANLNSSVKLLEVSHVRNHHESRGELDMLGNEQTAQFERRVVRTHEDTSVQQEETTQRGSAKAEPRSERATAKYQCYAIELMGPVF